MPSPQVGFNNNVKHRGRVFHIQTEDSGVSRPHITTHLFVDGGLIIKSCRTDYSDVVSSPDLVSILRRRMKEQHKSMFVDLREGRLDQEIDLALTRPHEHPTKVVRKTGVRSGRSKPPARRRSFTPAAARDERVIPISHTAGVGGRPPSSDQLRATRPSATFAAPDASSIFGGSSISEQSLDDVILSYISADLDGNAKTGE